MRRATPISASPPGAARATCSCAVRSCGSSRRPRWSTALVAEAEAIVAEGIDARLAAADENAEAIAAATREELLQIQGLDANHSDEKIDRIREIAD